MNVSDECVVCLRLFLLLIAFSGVEIPQLAYPVSCWWTFGFILILAIVNKAAVKFLDLPPTLHLQILINPLGFA